jgi:hypothetical protein
MVEGHGSFLLRPLSYVGAASRRGYHNALSLARYPGG